LSFLSILNRQALDATARENVAANISELIHFRQPMQPADDIVFRLFKLKAEWFNNLLNMIKFHNSA
jgi:hypothetical protein